MFLRAPWSSPGVAITNPWHKLQDALESRGTASPVSRSRSPPTPRTPVVDGECRSGVGRQLCDSEDWPPAGHVGRQA